MATATDRNVVDSSSDIEELPRYHPVATSSPYFSLWKAIVSFIYFAAIATTYVYSGSNLSPMQEHKSRQLSDDALVTAVFDIQGDMIPSTRSRTVGNAPRDKSILIPMSENSANLGISLIRHLRCIGNDELIQIYHCRSSQLAKDTQEFLKRLDTNLEIVDVCQEYVNENKLTEEESVKYQDGWIVPLALHHTKAKEVIVLDPSVIPLRNPSNVRQFPAYKETGSTFFHAKMTAKDELLAKRTSDSPFIRHFFDAFDYTSFRLTKPMYSQEHLNSYMYDGQSDRQQDGSMIVVDKSRPAPVVWDVLWHLMSKARFESDDSLDSQEALWLSYELSGQRYKFSNWGISAISSEAEGDMEEHPDTLCGSPAQFVPVKGASAELLYVQGKRVLEPYPNGYDATELSLIYNRAPSHIAPPQSPVLMDDATDYPEVCLQGLGATPLPHAFFQHLVFRRQLYMAAWIRRLDILSTCSFY